MNQVGPSRTLLMVDPCPETQALALEQAKTRGLSVITAPDPQVALTMLDMTVPDILLCDLFMPEMVGLSLMRDIRRRYPQTTMILTTAEGNETAILEALRAGAVDYLQKPVTGKELGQAFDRALQAVPQTVADAAGIEQAEYRLVIGADPAYVETTVAWLIQGTAMKLPETLRLHLRAALIELMVNAVEHGSLEIFYQEKHEALAKDQYDGLIAQRRRDPRYAKRRVTIRACYDRPAHCVRYAISDEGKGFRWKSFLTRADVPCDGRDANGRGVFLAKAFFPDLTYNERGNEVTFSVPLQ